MGKKWEELDKIWVSSSWQGSVNKKRMNQQPVRGMQRQAGLFFVPQCLWRLFILFSELSDLIIERAIRRERDKMAAIRTVWDKWVEQLPLLYNPNVTVDERLLPFKARCTYIQYVLSRGASEKNQGTGVVLDMAQRLRGHNITHNTVYVY